LRDDKQFRDNKKMLKLKKNKNLVSKYMYYNFRGQITY